MSASAFAKIGANIFSFSQQLAIKPREKKPIQNSRPLAEAHTQKG
jgi:hypothetical protein